MRLVHIITHKVLGLTGSLIVTTNCTFRLRNMQTQKDHVVAKDLLKSSTCLFQQRI